MDVQEGDEVKRGDALLSFEQLSYVDIDYTAIRSIIEWLPVVQVERWVGAVMWEQPKRICRNACVKQERG